MKDVQGIERGKCNICECDEYRPPPESGKFSCEYCGHRPTEHVRIVELGRCRTKGCDCDKYSSEVPNSYSECGYCGCSASTHEGADALRKKQQPQQQAGPPSPWYPTQPAPTVSVMSVTAGHMMPQQQQQPGMMGQTGASLQTMSQGKCAIPECPYGRRVEGNKIHPFCSRTCAQKAQGSFHAQKIASANQADKKGTTQAPPPVTAATGPPPGQQQPMHQQQKQPQSLPAQPQLTAVCKKCTVNPANQGRSWCESCFRQQQLQKP